MGSLFVGKNKWQEGLYGFENWDLIANMHYLYIMQSIIDIRPPSGLNNSWKGGHL